MTAALLIIAAGLIAVIYWQSRINIDQRSQFDIIIGHRNAEIERVQAEKVALLDRMYVKEHLPPTAVNISEQYEARAAAAKAETSANRDRSRPMQLGPVDVQRYEAFDRKAKEIEEQRIRNAANGNG